MNSVLRPAPETWTEEQYLAFDDNVLVEFSDGRAEFLDPPTTTHQLLVGHPAVALSTFASSRKLGVTLFAAFKMRLWPGTYREPDVLFMLKSNAARMHNEFREGADLVIEVVSEDRRRDLELKRAEYARAKIPEFWIVDPKLEQATVLTLNRDTYDVRGGFRRGEQATSVLLQSFAVNALFDAARI